MQGVFTVDNPVLFNIIQNRASETVSGSTLDRNCGFVPTGICLNQGNFRAVCTIFNTYTVLLFSSILMNAL